MAAIRRHIGTRGGGARRSALPAAALVAAVVAAALGACPAGASVPGRGSKPEKPPQVTAITPKYAPAKGGETIKITGKYLLHTLSVTFGGTPALSFKIISKKELQAVAPAGSVGRVILNVTTTGGESQQTVKCEGRHTSCEKFFNYEDLTVTEMLPAEGPQAGGNTITLHGYGFVPGSEETNVDFGAAHSPSVDCESLNTCTVLVPAHAAGKVAVVMYAHEHNNKTSALEYTYE